MRKISFDTPFDFSVSPLTGWTRGHWQEIFYTLMAGLLGSASPGHARQRIPGPRSRHDPVVDEMEGFSRSFIMAGAWLNTSPVDTYTYRGNTVDVATFYAEGLLAGTDPKHPEYWGPIRHYDQRLVECAAVAWSLHLARRHIWDRYTDAQKKQVAKYLFQCTTARYYACNWLLFGVVVNAALKRLGMPYSRRQMDKYLQACERMYVGKGWYRDGDENRFDYYNAWAFHYYTLQWALLDGDTKPDLAQLVRKRAAEFMRDFRYFVAGDGSAPCYGRSMIYRCAYLGPLALGYLLGGLEMDVGELKTMMNLGAKFFFDREILTERNHLGLGYLRPCDSMLEPYSCGGSPYWAVKALNLLLVPQEDPFWRTEEKPLPIHRGDFSVALDAPGFLLLGEKKSGHVQLVNHKSHHHAEYGPKYGKFAYSSIFGCDVRRIHGSFNCDNIMQFSKDGLVWHQRRTMENLYCEPGFAASHYRLDGADEEGEAITYTLVKDFCLLNFHRVITAKDLFFREGGYPLGFEEGEARTGSSSWSEAAWKEGRLTYIRNLFGYVSKTQAMAHGEDVGGSNVRYAKSVIPVLGYRSRGQRENYLASLVCGKTGEDSLDALDSLVSEFRVAANSAFVRFCDQEEVYLQIGRIRDVEVRVGGAPLKGAIVMARVARDGTRRIITARSDAAPAEPALESGGEKGERGKRWRWLCR